MRLHEAKFLKLLRECTRKIEIAAVGEFIPLIPPEFILVIDDVGFIWRIDRHHLLARKIGFTMVEETLVTEKLAALESAIGAQRGRRNCLLHTSDDRRNVIVKFQILRSDLKGGRTLLAGCH